MGFRYDTKHLTGQQQAIIRQRDTENKRLEEEAKKKREAEARKIVEQEQSTDKTTNNKE